ncbi:12006_t:CDS:2 [Dentiscutata heterogama]|uniref:12006_t:CDS:1 n=1 Tax=Dentiscutata heterogama TaxID=1316150 RepID=A0ACA9LEP8_9GLOM|nr:12006_t:CDS:2 [Dentiscutata heterogama]
MRELSRWYEIVYDNATKDKAELSILKAFRSADTIIPMLSTELPICSEDKLTSKLLLQKSF